MGTRQEQFSRAIKWIYNPRDKGPDSLRTAFIIVPLLILIITAISNGFGPYFWKRYFYSLLVGEGVTLACTLCSAIISFIGFRLLKTEIRPRTYFALNSAAMVPGLWLGFLVADYVYSENPSGHSYGDYSSGVVIGALFIAIFSLMDMWISAQKHTQDLETENLQAKLSALSAQMNPHLLFNALNTIASTIPSDPLAAEATTIKLSELYRGILTSSKRSSHRLSEELEICGAYLGIEASRFGDRLKWSITVEPGLEALEVPTLLIQPLVENAVKHGISPGIQGGEIAVKVFRKGENVCITIDDNGVGFGNSRVTTGTGTGVSSCRSRLELFYHGKASFEIGQVAQGTKVLIQIPGYPDGGGTP